MTCRRHVGPRAAYRPLRPARNLRWPFEAIRRSPPILPISRGSGSYSPDDEASAGIEFASLPRLDGSRRRDLAPDLPPMPSSNRDDAPSSKSRHSGEVPRLALSKAEAAESLGVSVDFLKEPVLHENRPSRQAAADSDRGASELARTKCLAYVGAMSSRSSPDRLTRWLPIGGALHAAAPP